VVKRDRSRLVASGDPPALFEDRGTLGLDVEPSELAVLIHDLPALQPETDRERRHQHRVHDRWFGERPIECQPGPHLVHRQHAEDRSDQHPRWQRTPRGRLETHEHDHQRHRVEGRIDHREQARQHRGDDQRGDRP